VLNCFASHADSHSKYPGIKKKEEKKNTENSKIKLKKKKKRGIKILGTGKTTFMTMN